MITLDEAVELLNNKNTEDDPRLLEFMVEVDHVGTDILKDKGEDYLMVAVAMIQSVAIALIVAEEGEPSIQSIRKLFEMMYDPEFAKVVTIAFKMSVGLAAVEELR